MPGDKIQFNGSPSSILWDWLNLPLNTHGEKKSKTLDEKKKKKRWRRSNILPHLSHRLSEASSTALQQLSCGPPTYPHRHLLQTPDKPRRPLPPTDTICIHLQSCAPAKRQMSSLADGLGDKLSLLWVLDLDRLYREPRQSEAASLRTWDRNLFFKRGKKSARCNGCSVCQINWRVIRHKSWRHMTTATGYKGVKRRKWKKYQKRKRKSRGALRMVGMWSFMVAAGTRDVECPCCHMSQTLK